MLKSTALLVALWFVASAPWVKAQSKPAPPHPANNPESPLMLAGDWVPPNAHDIDFASLPKVASEHAVVSDVRAPQTSRQTLDKKTGGVNQHNYLAFFNGRFWAMWSDGPGIEDRVGQRVKFATSPDGLKWTEPKFLTPVPPGSGPDSPHYATRTLKGFRYIARGFWERDGKMLALASLDEAAGFFGPSLALHAFELNPADESWKDLGVIYKDAINNFPPIRLRTGEWFMSRRAHDYKDSGVHFLAGGTKALDQWQSFPVFGSSSELKAEEPDWWILPDQNLMAVFRDNRKSGYLFRAFSTDDGRTWSKPIRTNFPDATSKISGLRLKDGRYVLVSNANPNKRDPLVLSVSDDGMVFNKMVYLVGGRHIDYPHVMEHEGHLLVAFAGGKQSIEVLKIRLSDLDAVKMKPYIAPPAAGLPAVAPADAAVGTILDNRDARVTVIGPWKSSTKDDGKYGADYISLDPGTTGSVRYAPLLPGAGGYDVYARWSARGVRENAVPLVITHAGGRQTVVVDQTRQGNLWVHLGRFQFPAEGGQVEVTANGSSRYVVADAVRFVPAEPSATQPATTQPATKAAADITDNARFDVVVQGATPGGIAAAIAAARLGRSVVLIDGHDHIGGMTASGLGKSDIENRAMIGGLFKEFVAGVLKHYVQTYGPGHDNVRLCQDGYYAEPAVAEGVFEAMVAEEPSITVMKGWRLQSATAEKDRITSITVVQRKTGVSRRLAGKVFIDGTYEGDLYAAAGAEFRIGRESRQAFNEPHAGVVYFNYQTHEFLPGTTGEGDDRLPAYTYRLCLTTDPANANRLTAPPPGYDRNNYVGYFDDLKAGRLAGPKTFKPGRGYNPAHFDTLVRALSVTQLPNGKTDVNINPRPLGFPFAEENVGYIAGDDATRQRIAERHRNLTLGLLWFLQNDAEIPEAHRKLANEMHLPKDEFTDNGGFPFYLYVREGRRLVGLCTLTEHDITGKGESPTRHPDTIAIGEFPIDSFPVRKRQPGDTVVLEGYLGMLDYITRPYEIPYRIMVPKKLDGLLAPVAASTTHVAFSSIRMEPTWMSLGQAAGTAAHLAIAREVEVRNVPVAELQELLRRQGAVLEHGKR